MPEPERCIAVAAGVLCTADRVLLGQRTAEAPHPLKWEFPGGKVEPGEDVTGALVRELREELAVEARTGQVLWHTQYRYPGGPAVEITFIHTTAIDQPPRNLVFADMRWIAIADLGALDVLEGDREFVGALCAGTIVPAPTRCNDGTLAAAPAPRRP